MPNIILKNREGEDVVYENVLAVQLYTDDGGTQRFTTGGGDFAISYMNDDGTEMLYSRPIMYGDSAGDVISLGLMEKPTKVTTEMEEHTFLGWAATIGGTVETAMFENVTQDLTVYAVFKTVTLVGKGTCGDAAMWRLNSEGVLTVFGEGAMHNYTFNNKAPWNDYIKDIKSVIIDDGVTSIGSYAFYNCTALTSITISDNVTSIGVCAFQYCSALISVSIPDGVTSISGYAFYGCTVLLSVNIPDSVTSIGNYAFQLCKALASVTIPAGVISIGINAFSYCPLTYAKFQAISGWWVNTEATATSGTLVAVTDTSTAATYLAKTYKEYYWHRS